MRVSVDLQIDENHDSGIHFEHSELSRYASLSLQKAGINDDEVELAIRIVNKEESRLLNKQFRNKDNPTNVLSFCAELPQFVPINLLGDLVICAEVVIEEAGEQNKSVTAHLCHMVVHGCLHLVGYDHINESDAVEMEQLEVTIMEALGFPDPYSSNGS